MYSVTEMFSTFMDMGHLLINFFQITEEVGQLVFI